MNYHDEIEEQNQIIIFCRTGFFFTAAAALDFCRFSTFWRLDPNINTNKKKLWFRWIIFRLALLLAASGEVRKKNKWEKSFRTFDMPWARHMWHVIDDRTPSQFISKSFTALGSPLSVVSVEYMLLSYLFSSFTHSGHDPWTRPSKRCDDGPYSAYSAILIYFFFALRLWANTVFPEKSPSLQIVVWEKKTAQSA